MITKEWNENAKAWTQKKFGDNECLGSNKLEQLDEMIDYIVRCLKEDYDHTIFENYLVPTREYSSKEMTELQELVFLMEETGKLLFPEMPDRVLSIMFDCYNIKYGTHGVREILNHFIKWKDTNK